MHTHFGRNYGLSISHINYYLFVVAQYFCRLFCDLLSEVRYHAIGVEFSLPVLNTDSHFLGFGGGWLKPEHTSTRVF